MPGDTLTIFSSLPAPGAARRRSRRASSTPRSWRCERRAARSGDFKVNFASARRRDRRRRPGRLGSRQDSRERPQGGREHAHDRLHRRVRLRRDRDLAADHERGRVRPGEPGVDRGRADEVRARARRRASPTSSIPSGDRTFARVVPADDVQASAAARWTRQLGARTVFVLGDRALEGDGLAELYRTAAGGAGLRDRGPGADGPARRRLPRPGRARSRKARPDAVYFGGGADSNARALWRDLHAALPERAPDRLPQPARARTFYGGSAAPSARTYITSVGAGPEPAARRAGSASCATTGASSASRPIRFAAYGHAAMSLLLDAIAARRRRRRRARASGRARLFDTTDFDSVVGTFSIDDNGDTSLDRIAGYRVRGGRLVFAASLRGEPAPAGKRSYGPSRLDALGQGDLGGRRRARDAGAARLVGDRLGDRLGDAAVEDARDDVVLRQLRRRRSPRRSPYAAASFISSVIAVARASSAPRKRPGKHSTLLIWFG